jgi:hypothetical protein
MGVSTQRGEVSSALFISKQLRLIQSGSHKIDQLTWYHNQDIGWLQLIDQLTHRQTGTWVGKPCLRGEMVNESGITQGDDREIAFVIDSLFCKAIDNGELHQWCEAKIASCSAEDVPAYLFDLLEFDRGPAFVFGVLGFHPLSGLSSGERSALFGVAYLRGASFYERSVGRDAAMSALQRHPEVLSRFLSIFRFIELPDEDYQLRRTQVRP